MKKITLKESELIDLIEKLVKENLSNGNGQNLGMMNTPTAKYKDLVEDEDLEGAQTQDLYILLLGYSPYQDFDRYHYLSFP
jgi:hypothetical protein